MNNLNTGPEASIPIEAIIGAPFHFLLDTWETAAPASEVSPEILARAPAIFKVLKSLTAHPGLDQLRIAVGAGDQRALSVLMSLNNFLGLACENLLERCKKWKLSQEWTGLGKEAQLTVDLAIAAGRDSDLALAWFLLANARRAIGDTRGTIAAYAEAIEAALKIGDEHLLGVAHDNLGNALKDLGKLDEALEHYNQALHYEHDQKGRNAILTNQSLAYVALGELHTAAQMLQARVVELEQAGTTGPELAIALDNAALPIAKLGEPEVALTMLARAQKLYAADDVANRAINALSRAQAHLALNDQTGAAQAFREAHDLAFKHARRSIDPEHYRRGFLAARKVRVPLDDLAYGLFFEGVKAKDAEQWGLALQRWQQASARAREAGDKALALRLDANAAALLYDQGQVETAIALAAQTRQSAAALGLATPEFMVTGTLGSISVTGGEIHDTLGPLGFLVRSKVLLEVQKRLVADAGLDPKEQQYEAFDGGHGDFELAKQAQDYHADDLAIRYLHDAVAKAKAAGGRFEVANRLVELYDVLSRSGNDQEAGQVATELAGLLSAGHLPYRAQIVGHRALGSHLADQNRSEAINHLRSACEAAEALRRQVGPGTQRDDVARQYFGIYRRLARLLRDAGQVVASFEALQGEKGRRLLDALSARAPADPAVSDKPPTADEIMKLLDTLGGESPTFLVDLVAESDGITAYLVGGGDVRLVQVSGDPNEFTVLDRGDVRDREASLVQVSLNSPLLTGLAAAVQKALPEGRRLLVVPDRFLCNLPLHLTPVQGRPWCDHIPLSYLEGAGTLRFTPKRRPPVGRALVAGDSRGDLVHAAAECQDVATALGTQPLVGPQCTFKAIGAMLQGGDFDIVHLALHGRGDAQRGGRASLLFADGSGGTEWVPFEKLTRLQWRAELVVFSGCSTALAGPNQGYALASLTRAAAETGAAAVIGCLWPVGDEAAQVCMTAFYKALVANRTAGPVDLRLMLDLARTALRGWLDPKNLAGARRRDGRVDEPITAAADPILTAALAWAPFILVGDPILGG